MLFTLFWLGISAVLIVIDRVIKDWVLINLTPVETIPIISGVLHLTYVENFGAAFSFFWKKTGLLVILTSVLLITILIFLVARIIKDKWLIVSFSLIFAGGLGNLLDRLIQQRGFVIDYIDFRLINFPVFNFADICVVSGTCLMLIHMILLEIKERKSVGAQKALVEKPEEKQKEAD